MVGGNVGNTVEMPLEDSRAGTLGYGRIPTGLVSTATKGSLYFDGATSFLTVANDTDFQLGTSDFTVEWFQRLSVDTEMPTLFSQGAFANTGLAITQTTSFSTQSNLLQPGDPIFVWPASSIVSTNTDVSKVIDGFSTTKYLNASRYDAGLIVRPSTQTIVNRVGFTTANDRPESDPVLFTIEGARDIVTTRTETVRGFVAVYPPTGISITAMATSGDDIYVGGNFTSIGGISATSIARFHSLTSTWTALPGLGNSTNVIFPSGTDVYVGGTFGIRRYNTLNGTYSSLGAGGPQGTVQSIAIDGGVLYAGGIFTTISVNTGTVTANRVARFTISTSTWSAMGSGLNERASAMTVIGTKLYVGGLFTSAGGVARNGIAVWNISTSAWESAGNSFNWVLSMASSGTDLYVGTDGQGFHILSTSSSSWTSNTPVFLTTIWNITVTNDFIYAVGVTNGRLDRISSQWSNLGQYNHGTGFTPNSFASVFLNGQFYTGGSTQSGGGAIQLAYMAYYDPFILTTFGGPVYSALYEPIAINLSTNCTTTRNSRSFSANLSNTTPYMAYRIRFPQLRDDLMASSLLQLAELELEGSSLLHRAQVVLNGSTMINAPVGPAVERWSHYALQRQTNTISLLQDGRFVSSFTFSYNFANQTDPLYIGRMKDMYNPVSTILTTVPATGISAFSTQSGGILQSIGSDAPTRKGTVWSTGVNPTILLSTQQAYTGLSMAGSFPNTMTGLEPSTLYYARSFATSVAGTGYGNQISFVTNPWSPYVSTLSLPNKSTVVGLSTAFVTATGTIISTNGSTVTTRGFVWDTNSTPTIALSTKTTEVGLFDLGFFSTPITLLNSTALYYLRAYAINGVGLTYGNLVQTVSITQPFLQLNTIATYLRNYFADFRNPNYYTYGCDGDATYINDGGGDMYDGGNFTTPWLRSGTTYVSNSGSPTNFPFRVSYAQTTAAVVDTDLSYVSLGYTAGAVIATQPLTVLSARSTTGPIGWQIGGNSGADGGGILASGFLYNNVTINGFTVYAFYRQTYNAGDPSHCNVFILLGHPNWGSVFGSVATFADPVINGGCGGYLFASGTSQNVLAIQTLLSKSGGVLVTASECQTVVTNFTQRVRESLGY
jgi:hypothetical protein